MKFYHFNPSELDCVATESDRGRSVQPCGPTSAPPAVCKRIPMYLSREAIQFCGRFPGIDVPANYHGV